MKIAYKHLLRFLKDKPTIESLSSKLFQLGHEHEIDNFIFDMDFTPNRGDCLSLIGLTRDLNALFETEIKLNLYDKDIPSLQLNFLNQSPYNCPEISFLNIQISDKIFKYKDYLEDYFLDLKINKNNFFTDVSNYVAYEMGQPVHSYDFSLIGNDITLKLSENASKFETLLGKVINLEKNELVFTSGNDVINLAGIVGGINTACSSKTNNALIECAHFIPESIIGKALKYDVHSDASHKYERSVDPLCHDKVLRRFIQIVSDHVPITKLEIFTYSSQAYKEIELEIDPTKINNILGLNESKNSYIKSLKRLGFKVNKTIKVPSFRNDINTQNDLAEELARVIGYDNIPTKPLKILQNITYPKDFIEGKIQDFLIKKGFTEVINNPFCDLTELNTIEVDNPLDSNRNYIRSNLTNSLVNNMLYNEKRQKDCIKLFEISDLYSFDNKIKSVKKLGIIISGRRGHNHINFSKSLNKEYLVNVFNELDIDIEKYIKVIQRDKLNSKIKTPIYNIEIPLSKFIGKLDNLSIPQYQFDDFIKYQPIAEFPSSYRDLSFSIIDKSKINILIEALENTASDNLVKLFMFDFFENKKTNETKIGYRFIFQSSNKTLTDEEINQSIESILIPILQIDSISLPGRVVK